MCDDDTEAAEAGPFDLEAGLQELLEDGMMGEDLSTDVQELWEVLAEARDETELEAVAEPPAEQADDPESARAEHPELDADTDIVEQFLVERSLHLVTFSFSRTNLRRIGDTTDIAIIHRVGDNGMKATCKNPAHGKSCICWVTRGWADRLMSDLVKWAADGLTTSADEHAEAARLVKISHGMKPRR